MVYLSKKQRKWIIIPLVVGLIGFELVDFFGSWLFNFEISSSVGVSVVCTFALAICLVNLIYYWRGEGASDRNRSDYLRMLIASTVILTLIMGGYWWFS